MALVLANRVQESATANTTVSFTLTGAIAGFQSFAVIGNTNTTYYSATDASGNWEVGLGTYSTTGPTLTRTTIYASSNSGSAVTFSGAVNVFVTYPSGRSVNLNESGNVSALGTVSSGTWQGSTIGVAYGGTGVTSSSGANSVVLRDANQNITVNRLNQANTDVTAAGGTTALTAASSYSQTLIGTGSQTFTMPDATTLTTGVAFIFNNNATGTLTLQDYASGSIGTVTSGGACELVLLANGTVAGTWDVHGFLPENVTWGTNALNMGSTVVSGGTWQGGTIQPAYGGTGLTSFVGANNALYSTGATTLTAGTLPVSAGGTGATTLTGYVKGNGTSAFTASASIPNSDTTATSANTANAIVARDASGNFSAGTITATLSGTASSATTATNLAGGVAGAVPYQSGTGTTAFSAAGTTGQLLTSAGTSAPTWSTTGTGVLTALAVNTGTAGSFVVNGGALGTPSSGTVTNLTGTASININGTVGATTPNTGAFTTLTTAGNVNLGNGATGQAYITRISGYGVDDGGLFGSYGTVIFNATGAYSPSARRFMLTNTVNGTDFALIRSTSATTDPTIGTMGAVTSGTVDMQISSATGTATFANGVQGNFVRASNGIVVNSQTISANYTIASGDNGLSAGPVTVNSGITVTVSSGSVWTVV